MSLLGLFKSPTSLNRISRMMLNARQFGDSQPFDFDWDIRRDYYAFNHAMLDNGVYAAQRDGGFREIILQETFGIEFQTDVRLLGYYNPIRTIVDAYQNVLRGTYGGEIKVAPEYDGKPIAPLLAQAAQNPIGRIWRWSNLDSTKQLMQEWAANLGTVGIRIVARTDTDASKRRVTIQFDHPGAIVDFNEDDRGNVTEIELQYNALAGELGAKRKDVKVKELITKTRFVKEVNGRNILETDQQRNELGVCPYVVLRHSDDGHEFGRWAYAGSETIIHGINWLISNQGESIVDHNFATWFATGGGDPPKQFDLGRKKVAYVKTSPDAPNPSLQPLVAPLNQDGARAFWMELVGKLRQRQPEIVLGDIDALSGQSGETIAKLQIAAEAKIEQAKANYEHALIRALQIGLSEGIRLSLWDLGTGGGSPEAADRAYENGAENFEFVKRPALPETVFDQINRAKAETAPQSAKLDLANKAANVVDQQKQLELAGFKPKEVTDIMARKKTEGVIPTELL